MLVISRRKGQRIAIGDDIELVVTELHRSSVKLGIRAPRGYAVLRGEIRDSIEEANREAAESSFEDVHLDAPQALQSSQKAPTQLLGRRQSPGDDDDDDGRQFEVIIRRRPKAVIAESTTPEPEAAKER